MDFDWSKPMDIDWNTRTRLINQEDINNSVINRILKNKFYAPFCEREIIRVKPWWDPDDPFGTNSGNSRTAKDKKFIPGLYPLPVYPQLSALSKQVHQQCLRVLAAEYDVQPRDYPRPTQNDYHAFEKIKELYETEQKQYIKWAKKSWINGDCIRALRPKPTVEQVYEAEFKMRVNEINSLPQNYIMAAQIPLETKNQAFELEHKQDLINVNIQDLPIVEYPEEMVSDFSILNPCPLPEPCAKHPCKFMLPYENSVSNLPLAEVNHELAQFAINNGVSFIASENALHCLLETERSWKIPISVVEVTGPDGDSRNVTVLGSEFGVQKECATRRTYKAYKHLLRHRFAPCTGHYKMKASAQQTATSSTVKLVGEAIAQRHNRIESLDEDLAVSSDDDNRLQIDDQAKNSPKRLKAAECTSSDNEFSQLNQSDGEPSSEPDRLIIDDNDETDEVATPSFFEANEDSAEPIYSIDNSDITFNEAVCHKNRKDSASSALKIHNSNNETSNKNPECNEDFAEPDTRNSSFIDTINSNDKSPLKPILRKPSFSDSSPRNSKRKLSFNDPLTSDPDFMNYSEPDSEEDVAGFVNGVAVPANQPKNNQNETVIRTYPLRSRNKPNTKPATAAKNTKTNSGFTKITPKTIKQNKHLETFSPRSQRISTNSDGCSRRMSLASNTGKTNQQTNTENVGLRRSPRVLAHSGDQNHHCHQSDSDDSDGSCCSRRISMVSNIAKPNMKTNKRTETETVELRRSRRISRLFTDASDDSDCSHRSHRTSIASNTRKINKQTKSESASLRRSRRISSRLNADSDSDDSQKHETMKNYSVGLRRSRRLSTRSTKENVPPETNQTQTNKNSLSLKIAKISKRHQRKSLPANIFSNAVKLNQVVRSKSVTNLNDIADVKKIQRSGSKSFSNSTKTLNTRNSTKLSLELSERTKRYLRRVFNLVSSETDQSDEDVSERTKRYISLKISSAYSKEEKQETEYKKRSKRCTRSNSTYARNSNTSNTGAFSTELINKETAERTKRYVHRSIPSAYSSCEETDQPTPITNNKSKRQPKKIRTGIDCNTNTMDSSSATDTNQINQSNTIHIKTEVIDTTESTIHKMGQSVNENNVETHEITLYLHEETNENIDETDTLEMSRSTEPNLDTREESLLITKEELFDSDLDNVNEVKEFNILHFTATTEMEVSGTESSDSENETYICHNNTLDSRNNLSRNTINETKEHYMKTEICTEEIRLQTDPNGTITSRKFSISESSDSSDYYFDTNETEELNMFHFTATNNTDSEDESEIEDTQTVDNSLSEDLDPTIISRTEKEKIKETERNETQKIMNVTNEISLNRNNSVFPSTSSLSLKTYHEMDTAGLSPEVINTIIGVQNCTCKGTSFEVPPPRSFKKWQLKNITSNVNFNIIVHSSHKVRKDTHEVLLEPIVEYQPELGGAKQSAGKIRALALALMLRESAELINVRVDHNNGNVIAVERMSSERLAERCGGGLRDDIADSLHTALDQLRYLMPAQYVLKHDSCHGANAMLYTTKGVRSAGAGAAGAPHRLSLRRHDDANMPYPDEVEFARIPPELGPALLPYHKHRSILPLAFTPYNSQVREDKKADAAALARAKQRPSAIQWPKKKKKSKNTRQRQSARRT